MQTLRRKLDSFLSWSWHKRWLFLQAFIGLGIARLATLSIPFRWIAKRMGTSQLETPVQALAPQEREIVREIAWAVRHASRYTPWQSNCLPQAITAKRMLHKNKIKSTLYLGLRKGENPANLDALSAHAWLRSGKFYVTGGRGEDAHTVVAAFGDR